MGPWHGGASRALTPALSPAPHRLLSPVPVPGTALAVRRMMPSDERRGALARRLRRTQGYLTRLLVLQWPGLVHRAMSRLRCEATAAAEREAAGEAVGGAAAAMATAVATAVATAAHGHEGGAPRARDQICVLTGERLGDSSVLLAPSAVALALLLLLLAAATSRLRSPASLSGHRGASATADGGLTALSGPYAPPMAVWEGVSALRFAALSAASVALSEQAELMLGAWLLVVCTVCAARLAYRPHLLDAYAHLCTGYDGLLLLLLILVLLHELHAARGAAEAASRATFAAALPHALARSSPPLVTEGADCRRAGLHSALGSACLSLFYPAAIGATLAVTCATAVLAALVDLRSHRLMSALLLRAHPPRELGPWAHHALSPSACRAALRLPPSKRRLLAAQLRRVLRADGEPPPSADAARLALVLHDALPGLADWALVAPSTELAALQALLPRLTAAGTSASGPATRALRRPAAVGLLAQLLEVSTTWHVHVHVGKWTPRAAPRGERARLAADPSPPAPLGLRPSPRLC